MAGAMIIAEKLILIKTTQPLDAQHLLHPL